MMFGNYSFDGKWDHNEKGRDLRKWASYNCNKYQCQITSTNGERELGMIYSVFSEACRGVVFGSAIAPTLSANLFSAQRKFSKRPR